MTVFLDTNVLSSALTTRRLYADLFDVVLQPHDLLISDSVLCELERILPGKLGQSEEVTKEFINLLQTNAALYSAVKLNQTPRVNTLEPVPSNATVSQSASNPPSLQNLRPRSTRTAPPYLAESYGLRGQKGAL